MKLLLVCLFVATVSAQQLVPVSFYVMSKWASVVFAVVYALLSCRCPDFRYCTQAFASAFAGIESIVDLKVCYLVFGL